MRLNDGMHVFGYSVFNTQLSQSTRIIRSESGSAKSVFLFLAHQGPVVQN